MSSKEKRINWKGRLDRLLNIADEASWAGGGDPDEIDNKKERFNIEYNKFLDLLLQKVK